MILGTLKSCLDCLFYINNPKSLGESVTRVYPTIGGLNSSLRLILNELEPEVSSSCGEILVVWGYRLLVRGWLKPHGLGTIHLTLNRLLSLNIHIHGEYSSTGNIQQGQ